MDGLEACREIQKIDAQDRPLVVAVTADVLAGIEDKCREAGMVDYLSKPIKKQLLVKVLRNVGRLLEYGVINGRKRSMVM